MDHFQGITARIISDGQVLKLYDDPDAAGIEDSHARHHYVEAVAGSTFVVKVDLKPHFQFYEMKPEHAIRVHVSIDGHALISFTTSTKECLQKSFSQGKTHTTTFSGPRHFCQETGRWLQSDYSFGNLVLKEISNFGLSVKQAQDLGTIEVTVQRVRLGELQKLVHALETHITTIDEVPEKALKGRPIETTIRYANARTASKPPDQHQKSAGISGKAGKPVVFNIHYRSRRALQMLGCIPRSPSPAINNSNTTTGTAGSSDEMLRQIQVLNARITDLERDKIKAEAANTGSVIKNEGAGVKREREEDDSQKESRQRRRTAAQIEHIDLTGD